MSLLDSGRLQELINQQESPCISLYQPTPPQYPDSRQNPVGFKNLVREIGNALRERYPAFDGGDLLKRFEALIEDRDFWQHRTPGLAVLANPNRFDVLDLPRSVPELAIVADSFHVKPLIRILQSADRFQVLAIGLQEASLYEGNRDELLPIALGTVPATLTDALGQELSEPYRASYPSGRGAGATVHFGQGSKKEEVDVDRERFAQTR